MCKSVFLYKLCHTKGERRFKTNDAAWRLRNRSLLLFPAMGRVVGGNDVYCSVPKSLDNCKTVRLFPKRRIHLCQCSVLDCRLFGKAEMVRCGFGMNCIPSKSGCFLLCFPDKLHAFFCADMLDV